MLVLTNSGWTLNGQPTTLASWFPKGRIATINENINVPVIIQTGDLTLLGNAFTLSTLPSLETPLEISNQSSIAISDLTINGRSVGIGLNNANNIRLTNITINNSSLGVDNNSSNNTSLYNVEICGGDMGMEFTDSSNVTIVNCKFQLCSLAALSLDSCQNSGISNNYFCQNESAIQALYSCQDIGIYNNLFENNRFTGILFSGPRNTLIKNNTFMNDEVIAFNIFNISPDNVIEDNLFVNSAVGIGVFEFSNRNSILSNNMTTIETGIINDSSDDTRIIGNTINKQNGDGIMIVSGNNLVIMDNTITGSPSPSNEGAIKNDLLPNHLKNIAQAQPNPVKKSSKTVPSKFFIPKSSV